MKRFLLATVCAVLFLSMTNGQQYDYDQGYDQDSSYGQDNLYEAYAMKQQDKEVGRGVGGGWGKVLVGTGIGWFVGGKIHAQRKEKKLNKKHKEEQKALYTQYYNDVYSLQTQNAELAQALEQMGVKLR